MTKKMNVLQSEAKVSKAGKPYFPAVVQVEDQVGKTFLDQAYAPGEYEVEVSVRPNFNDMMFAPVFKVGKPSKPTA